MQGRLPPTLMPVMSSVDGKPTSFSFAGHGVDTLSGRCYPA
ncbi:hypothetical protein [Escherichia coli]